MLEKTIIDILSIARIILLGIVSIGACLYCIPLIFIRRFHTPLHFLSLNVCIAVFVCSTFWAIYYVMNGYYPQKLWTPRSCLAVRYGQNMVNCQVLYGLCMVSLNRLFVIVYKSKALFRTKKWAAVCISVQWIFATLLPLPMMASNFNDCLTSGLELYYRVFLLIIVGVIPAVSLAVTNCIIFIYARRSSQRAQPGANGESAQTTTFGHRDARLLKHMVFMFAVFFCSWEPIYIIFSINWSQVPVSAISLEIFLTIPVVSLFIDVADLFLYNHELRRYLTNKRQNNPIAHQRK